VSEQNVELHRRIVEAYNAHDIEALIAHLDSGVELHPVFAAAGGAVYHGHDGIRSWHRDQEEAFGDELRVEPEAYFDLGEQTLLFYVLRGRGRQSGAEVAMPFAQVIRWHDGAGIYSKMYGSREDALTELGVSQDALEPTAP
jgi:SnoaL-like domain